jgi:hypothetical protein
MGEAFFNLAKAIELLVANKEKKLTTFVDAVGVEGKIPSS